MRLEHKFIKLYPMPFVLENFNTFKKIASF